MTAQDELDAVASPPRPSVKRKAAKGRRSRFPLVALLTLVGIGGYGWSLTRPASSQRLVTPIDIPSGAGVTGTGAILKENRLVRSAFVFDLYARIKGKGKLRAGHYLLSPDMTLGQITRTLEAGPRRQGDARVRVTIPEGYTLEQIAETLDEKKITDGAAWLKMATNKAAIEDLRADSSLGFTLPKEADSSLEGYLFPDTYGFAPGSAPRDVLKTMLANFGTKFARPYQQEIEGSGKNMPTLVTVASLVEREARVAQDRARIAGVIDNRLRNHMKLQIDATVEYALPEYKSRLSFKDLRVNSPYNTYLHDGLPPGPIASPGLASLTAALHPEQNPYLYYVALPNGAHLFTSTPREHEAAIREAQRQRQGR